MHTVTILCALLGVVFLPQATVGAADNDPEASYSGPWTAMFGSATGAVIISADQTALPCFADFTTLTPGKREQTRHGTITATGCALALDVWGHAGPTLGMLSDGGNSFAGQPVVARWITMTSTNGIDDISTSVPVPIAYASALAVRCREVQARMMDPGYFQDPKRQPSATGPRPFYPECWWSRSGTTVTWWSAHLVSMIDDPEIYTGGAHENWEAHSFTWILRADGSWSDLHLADLFTAPDWRQTLYRLTAEDLSQQVPDDLIWAGRAKGRITDAQADAFFKTWTLAGDGLIIHFDPYDVDCFAHGEYDVRIPWSKLPALNPAMPLQEIRGQP
jgi:hypothetical protein